MNLKQTRGQGVFVLHATEVEVGQNRKATADWKIEWRYSASLAVESKLERTTVELVGANGVEEVEEGLV